MGLYYYLTVLYINYAGHCSPFLLFLLCRITLCQLHFEEHKMQKRLNYLNVISNSLTCAPGSSALLSSSPLHSCIPITLSYLVLLPFHLLSPHIFTPPLLFSPSFFSSFSSFMSVSAAHWLMLLNPFLWMVAEVESLSKTCFFPYL